MRSVAKRMAAKPSSSCDLVVVVVVVGIALLLPSVTHSFSVVKVVKTRSTITWMDQKLIHHYSEQYERQKQSSFLSNSLNLASTSSFSTTDDVNNGIYKNPFVFQRQVRSSSFLMMTTTTKASATTTNLFQSMSSVPIEKDQQRKEEGYNNDNNKINENIIPNGKGSILVVNASTTEEDDDYLDEIIDGQTLEDIEYMKIAIDLAQEDGGERGEQSAYPNPTVGAVLVSYDEKTGMPYVLGQGRSTYDTDAVVACIENVSGDIEVMPLQEWAVSWQANPTLRRALKRSTLYVTLEPSPRRQGTAMPPITSLIRQLGIRRVVIGCTDPVPEYEFKGAETLHRSGIQVVTDLLQNYVVDPTIHESCKECISEYANRANSKLQRMARKHFEQFHRPLGFLHCSVVASENVEAFARHGNAFGTNFGGQVLGFRNRGAYELAPPPDVIWADEEDDDTMDPTSNDDDSSWNLDVDFEEENFQGDMPAGNPMMPWYEQVDAVVATFPRSGNGPPDDDSITARLSGLKWLATYGNALPAGVERILVMDATDLQDLPVKNDDPNLPKNVDIEAFWKANGRKRTRVLLRRGLNESARAAAQAAAAATAAAAKAAQEAASAIESGDSERAAQAALDCQKAAEASAAFIQQELIRTQQLRRILEEEYNVIVETIEGGEPYDVMKHLGERNGMQSVVWRAGCWGERGVRAILAGAFQWVSAHLAVDAVGGRFWQLMIAENAVQAACGPESKIKVFADQEDISMEYCDEPEVDDDCVLTVEGRPVRHVRLDCRVALVDEERPREFAIAKTAKINHKILTEEAPWFL